MHERAYSSYVSGRVTSIADVAAQQFGPLSGVSHEVRVVSAYMAGQLEASSEEAKLGVKMCLECGNKGHFPRHCPVTLLHQ